MALSASGNSQVRGVSHDEVAFLPSVLGLVVPTPPVSKEQIPTPTNTASVPREPLGLTEEEEKELAELMEDEDGI